MYMKKLLAVLLCLGLLVFSIPVYSADEATLGNSRWKVENDGDFVPITDSSYDIGASGAEVSNVYVDTLVLNGTSITSANQISSPMEDAGTYTRTIDAGDNIKLYDNGAITAVGAITGGSFIMDNGATLDNAVNNYVTLVENSDTLTLYFDGTDVSIDQSGGGLTVKLTDASNGTFDIYTNNVSTDYLSISQGTNQATITATGTGNDLYLAAAGGDINCADENITTTGAISCGSISGFTSMTLGDDTVSLSADDILQWASNDEDATVNLLGANDKDAVVLLSADNSDDSGDDWKIESDQSTNSFILSNDTSGSQAAKLTVSTSGNVTLGGDRLILGDGEYIDNTTDDTVRISSNDSSVILDVYSANTSDGTVSVTLQGDAGTDATDSWRIQNPADATLTIANDSAVAGTYVTKLTIAGADGDITTTGDIEIVDDMDIVFGTNADWKVQYDEAVDDQLLFITANTLCTATTDPMFEILVGTTPTANQQVFGIGKGTQASNTALLTVDAEGDVIITSDLTITGDGLNSAGDLLITPTGTEVHINGGLDVGGTSAVGDNNLNVDGTTAVQGGAITLTGTTPILTVGDGGNEDVTIKFDGQSTKDFYVATDNADDSLIIGYGSTVGTDSRITVQDDADETRIELGDAAEFDTVVVFDGNAQDYYIALDDAGTYPDDLVIGKGATVATTPAIVIDNTNADVAVINDLTVSGGDVTAASATASKPVLWLENTADDATCPIIQLENDRATETDGDDLGIIKFIGSDSGDATCDFVTILAEANEINAGDEAGKLSINMEVNDADTQFIQMFGDTTNVDTAHIEFNSGTVDIDVHMDTQNIADAFLLDAGSDALGINVATTISEELDITCNAADEELNFVQSAVAGTADTPFILIDDERTGATANTAGEATLMIDPQGTHAINVVDGISYFGGAIEGATTLTMTGDVAVNGDNLTCDGTLSIDAATGLVLNTTDAAAGTSLTYVSITGTTPAHGAATPTDIMLDITPTWGINTVETTQHMIDLTYTTPAWATAVASNNRAIYIAPTIGNATLGTNAANMIEVAAITGDAQVTLNALKIGALTGTGATEYAINIGAGWDAGLYNSSAATILGDVDLGADDDAANLTLHHASYAKFWDASDDVSMSVSMGSDGNPVLQATASVVAPVFEIVSIDGDATGDATLRLSADLSADAGDTWNIISVANGNTLAIKNEATAIMTMSTAGVVTLNAGGLTLSNGELLTNATDDSVRIASDDSSTILDIYSPNTSNGTASLRLLGDASADITDDWQIQNPADGTLTFGNDSGIVGTYVTKLTLSSAGAITTTGNISVQGTAPLVTIGDGGDEDTGIQINSDTADYYIASENSVDSLIIGYGSAIGTTPAITVDANQDVTLAQDLAVSGDFAAGYEMVTTSAADPGVGTANLKKILTAITSDETGASADQVSLAAGKAGQIKAFKLAVDGETAGTTVVADFAGATANALMEDAGDSLILISDGTEWHIILNNGATLS